MSVGPVRGCFSSLLRGARAVDSSETSSAEAAEQLRNEMWVTACGLFRPSPPPALGFPSFFHERKSRNGWQEAGAGRSA